MELAAEYYYGTGDSIEAQTAFLRGIVCSYAGSSDSALVFLHHAYDLASADSSWFYAGVDSTIFADAPYFRQKVLVNTAEVKYELGEYDDVA